MPPETCPNCGADLDPKAKACPECGSCEATGWSDEARTDGLDLPDDSFNYDEYVRQEFEPKPLLPRGTRLLWLVVALILVAILLGFVFRF